MSDDIAIKVDHVSKTFKLPHEKTNSIKGAVINFYKRNKSYETQQALKDISFEVKKGEFFGIVGRNGSGKSTLLKMLAGIYSPSRGGITVKGKLTPFIELGVGFNQELSGRENVFLNGALLGFNRKEMDAMYQDIVDFAELERFMDQKLKNYSSGMQVRLAFSIAIRAKSDILLIDEVLAVGDAIFQKKCYEYFKQLKKEEKTVIFVSHDSSALQEYCASGILIDEGNIVSSGPIKTVVKDYTDLLNKAEETSDSGGVITKKKRWGTKDIVVLRADTVDLNQKEKIVFTEADSEIIVRVDYEARANQEIVGPVYGITITDGSGQNIFLSNTMWSEIETGKVNSGEVCTIEWNVPNVFNTGDYYVSPAVANKTGYTTFDWRESFIKFKVRKTLKSSGIINTPHQITIKEQS